MFFFDRAVNPAESVWAYHSQPADTDFVFKTLPSARELMAELKQARDAYQLVVGQEMTGVGFYEELGAAPRERESR